MSADTGIDNCPFCDGIARTESVPYESLTGINAGAHYFWVQCVSCAAQGGWGRSVGMAIRLWNTRAPAEACKAGKS